MLGNNGNSRFSLPIGMLQKPSPETQGKVWVGQSIPCPVAGQVAAGPDHFKGDLLNQFHMKIFDEGGTHMVSDPE